MALIHVARPADQHQCITTSSTWRQQLLATSQQSHELEVYPLIELEVYPLIELEVYPLIELEVDQRQSLKVIKLL